jgi:hypothetical protein
MSPSSSSSTTVHCWTASSDAASTSSIDCVCLGTGRFLRAVLVPALAQSGYRTALIQPRGRVLLDALLLRSNEAEGDDTDGARTYEVDTVLATGEIETSRVPIHGAFSLGALDDRQALFDWLRSYRFSTNDSNGGIPRVLGVGVTEAGLSGSDTPAMRDLYEILQCFCSTYSSRSSSSSSADSSGSRMSVINTDNVPMNGDVIKAHMLHIAQQQRGDDRMVEFLSERVFFHNSMVDRITSHRPNDALVPRAEPMPAKALVVLDPLRLLDPLSNVAGVVLRKSVQELQNDIELKLRVANGTHTALAHVLALLGIAMTNHVVNGEAFVAAPGETPSEADASPLELLVRYLDSLVESAIVPAWVSVSAPHVNSRESPADRDRAVRDAWDDWRRRLWHPSFGLSSFFITQNGPAKGGIRLGPTIRDLMGLTEIASSSSSTTSKVPVTIAYAFAALLRWLTPREIGNSAGVYRGWLQPSRLVLSRTSPAPDESRDVAYADGLRYNLVNGWYEFRCACTVSRSNANGDSLALSDWLASITRQPQQPLAYCDAIRAYLLAPEGGNLADVAATRPTEMDTLVKATATLYARMVAGDDLLELLEEMQSKKGVYSEGMETSCSAIVDDVSIDGGRPLHYRE